jgi:hypothetical protein
MLMALSVFMAADLAQTVSLAPALAGGARPTVAALSRTAGEGGAGVARAG